MATPIPVNHAAFTLDEILSATGGSVVVRGAASRVCGVTTDSRAAVAGSLFVALRGDTFDGHAHVASAAAAGAVVALVDRAVEAPASVTLVRVESTLDGLGAIARLHTRRWRARGGRRVVAITGSAGKTTTRVAVTALAESAWPGAVLSTRGNLNNRIGLPMTLLALEDRHELAVVELGMNQPGEIEALASVAEPDVGVVTLVAAAHTELLGSIAGVAHEKGALFRALAPDCVAIGNADDDNVRAHLTKSHARRRLLYGHAPDADVRIALREVVGMTRSRVSLDVLDPSASSASSGTARSVVSFDTPLLGEAGALASAAAVAVVRLALGHAVTGEAAQRAFELAEVGAGAGRLVPRIFADGLAVVDDSYNANPASMRASIRAVAELAQITSRRLVLVLGEMLELGEGADEAHAEIGRVAAASGAEVIVAVSGRARWIADAARSAGVWAEFREDVLDATNVVARAVTSADLVLVKGSRGVATEGIVRTLEEIHQARPTTRTPFSSRPPEGEGKAREGA